MLDIRYFRNRAFSSGTGGMMLVFMAMFGSMFLMTQYFQIILGYSPLATALRLLPMAPIMIIVAPLTPRLSARFGANRTVAGRHGAHRLRLHDPAHPHGRLVRRRGHAGPRAR